MSRWSKLYEAFDKLWTTEPRNARFKGRRNATMQELWDLYTPCLPPDKVEELNAMKTWAERLNRSQAYNELHYVYELTAANSAIGEWARASFAADPADPLPEGRRRALKGTEIKTLHDALRKDRQAGQPEGRGPQFLEAVTKVEHPLNPEN